jgi:UDP-N-acetylglucosamine acyltransferase
MIHPSAVIDQEAELASDVQVGAFTVIGPGVTIGAGTRIGSHCVLEGPLQIGTDNRIYNFAAVGGDPQDKKFKGEQTQLVIGNNNTIREFTTLHRGTVDGGGATSIGDDNWIMAYVHIAHDCHVANHTILGNCASLAGHVTVGDYAILSGFTLVHQFCKIGAHAFCAMGAKINADVPPYVVAAGDMSVPRGINTEGLKRRGFSSEDILAIKRGYKALYTSELPLAQARIKLAEMAADDRNIALFLEFIEQSERGLLR